MKRVISIFLSVVMLVSVIAGVDLSAYAEVNDSASVTTISIERSFEEHMLGSTFAVSASYRSDTYAHNEDTISYEISGNNGGLVLDGGMSCIGTKEDGIVSIPFKAVKVGTYTITLKTIDGATDSITIEINEKLYNVYVASRLIERKEKIKNTNMLYHYIFNEPLDTTDFLSSWYINDEFKANKEYYYETVLLDILLKQSNDKDYISYLNKTIENISSKCISYSLNYFEDSTENAIKSKKFSSLTIEEKENLNQAYANATGINNIWDAVSSIKSGVDTVKDYFDKLSKYAALQNINEEYIEVLRYINILALQDSSGELSVNATLLSNACENLIEIYSNKNVAVADCFKKTASTIIWDLVEDATKEALKLMFGESASAIKITKDISLLVANSVFAADDILKSSCLIKTTNYIEKYLKEALDSCGSEFNSNPEQYADDYIACHELLISCFNYGESVHKYYSRLLYNDTVSAKVGSFLNSREKVVYEDIFECLEICDGLIATENKFFDSVISEYNSYKNGNKIQWVITLDTNAEFAFSSDIYVYDGDVIDLSSYKPQRNGYEFKGWYYDRNCNNAFEEGTVATTYLTLYAKWIQSSEYIIKANTAEISQYNLQYTATPVSPKKAKAKSTQEYYYDIDIPAYIDGYEVTSIGNTAFNNCSNYNISSVRIPNTVTTISKNAFNNLPESIAIIADKNSAAETFAYENGYMSSNQNDGTFKYRISNGEAEITGFVFGYEKDEVIIPSKINSYLVTSIGDQAFRDCTRLTSIILSNSVTNIGDYAFYGCAGLTNITIPDSVKSIGHCAFYGCSSLTSVTIGNSVRSIDQYIFGQCSSLKSITIGNNVKSIGEGAFAHTSLTSINVDGNNQYYSSQDGVLFNKGKTELIQYPIGNTRTRYTIPESVTSIDNLAFRYCTSLTNVTIPESVTSIGGSAFYNCTSLTKVTIPDSASIVDSTFEYCPIQILTIKSGIGSSNLNLLLNCIPCSAYDVPKDDPKYLSENGVLFNKDKTELIRYPIKKEDTSYETPNGVTNITDDAFKYCTLLTSIQISDSVTRIGEYAFYNCSSLMNITIPDNITRIEKYAFLNTAYYNDESNWKDGILYIDDCLIRVTNSVSAYVPKNELKIIAQNAFKDSYSSLIINDFELDVGGHNSFSITKYTGNATDLIIPKQLYGYDIHSIDEYAFYGCSSLKSIDVQGVEIFGMGVFLDCENLTDVILSGNPTYIERQMFMNCTSLINITIPDSVTDIYWSAFENCTSLKNIRIPNNVEFIGRDAFANTGYYNDEANWENDVLYINKHLIAAKDTINGLYTVNSGTKSIVAEAFKDCTALTGITIPDSVTSVSSEAFSGCTNLTSAIISNNITAISDRLFYKCENLESVKIPDSVTEIDDYAFCKCSALTKLEIPDSVTNIGSSAFGNCTSLTSITIPDQVEVYWWNDDMLKGCSSLENIFVGENNTSCTSVDGVLYNKEKTKLIQYPAAKSNSGFTIPNSVIEIGKYAFEHCYNLTEITVLPENTSYCSENGVLFSKDKTNLLRYPAAKADKDYVVPDSVTDISEGAFFDNDKLECLTVSKNVKRIAPDDSSMWYSLDEGHPGAFYNNTSLKKIIWNAERCYLVSEDEHFDPESPNYNPIYALCIYASIFPSCTEFVIGEEVKYIPCLVLANNQNIKSINISDSVASIGVGAFYNCTNLIDIYYSGTKSQWNNVIINNGNDILLNSNIHCADGAICKEHAWDDGVVKVIPTCKEKGQLLCTCLNCGITKTEEIPMQHNLIDGICGTCGMLEEDCIESPHPYDNDYDNTWTITKPNAKRIAITFSSDTETESCDYIYLYDSDDNQVGKYSGTELAGKRVNVKGDTVKIRLVTDGSVTYYGFALSNVQAYYEDCSHSETELRSVREATCSETGYTGDICCVECDEMITHGTEIPMNDTHDMRQEVIAPTCSEQGYTRNYCYNCYEEYRTDYIPATGVHAYVNGFCKYCQAKDADYAVPVINNNQPQSVEIKNGGDCYYVSFTPAANGTYSFYSTGEYDTYGCLYDENMNLLVSDDDGGESCNFSITYDLQKGRTYIFACQMLYSDETGNFDVVLSAINIEEHQHNYAPAVTAPTCTEKGYTTYTCTCGDSYVDNYVNATGHNYTSKTTAPTCTENGYTVYTCSACNDSYTANYVNAAGHTPASAVTEKATTGADGMITATCSVCGVTLSTTVIPKASNIKLSKTSYTYNGKVQKPGVTVKDSKGKTLKNGTDYTVSYAKGRKNVGKYSVKITFKGNYSGSKTLYFTITPKGTSLSKVTAGKKKCTVKWKKQTSQTTGYQIQYSTDKNFKKNNKTVTVTKNKTTSKTISKLKAKKKYYVRIRTYKTVKVNGKNTKIYSSWSKAKTVTTKK